MNLNPRSVSSAKLLLSAVTVLRLLLRDGGRELEAHLDRRRNGEQLRLVEKQIMPLLGQLKDKNGNQLGLSCAKLRLNCNKLRLPKKKIFFKKLNNV